MKNRIAFPPMNTNFSDVNGAVSEQTIAYYAARAKGGCGFIVVDATSIDPQSKKHGLQPMFYDDRYVSGYEKLVEAIHRYGAKASIEIIHYGSETPYPDGPKKSASDVSSIAGNRVIPYTVEEIHGVQNQFIKTAELAKYAGFDAVTLHATHGYLIAQFLSPLYNRRTDEYGGSVENRFRFLKEIIGGIKEKNGKNYPVIVRFSADEYIEGGRTIEESIELARLSEQAGADAIDISAAVPSSYMFTIAPGTLPGFKGLQIKNSKRIKEAVSIPVIIAGGIRTIDMAEQIIKDKAADIVAMGRSQIADPEFVNKAFIDHTEEIRPCLTCLTCFYSLGKKHCLRCAVNPEAGKEYQKNKIEKDASGKVAAIIGGGPAGMEAALIAAQRGYTTYLYEKNDHLGGSLNPASVPYGKSDFNLLTEWFKNQLNKYKLKVHLSCEYTEEINNDLKPALLVNAAGADYSRNIPGSDNDFVISAAEALMYPEKVGNDIIIIGGGNTGCEAAEYFSNEGIDISFLRAKNLAGDLKYEVQKTELPSKRKVTLIEYVDQVGRDIGRLHKALMDIRLKEGNVEIITSCAADLIEKDGTVHIRNTVTGEKRQLKADTVILAVGLKPKRLNPYYSAEKIINIGDANQVANIKDAISGAYYLMLE
ncbi:MAG: FAD-dependent oxidoreductase [Lachnospiraceae bacterium]|nr:FAD-dependent oxidoreductase [Candidatus Minthocola equi]